MNRPGSDNCKVIIMPLERGSLGILGVDHERRDRLFPQPRPVSAKWEPRRDCGPRADELRPLCIANSSRSAPDPHRDTTRQRLGEWHIQWMHPVAIENVDRASKGRGDRRDKHGVAPVRELFNDECRDQSLFDLGQRGLPGLPAALTGQLLGQASDNCVSWNSLEEGLFDPIPDRPSGPSEDRKADQEARQEHQQKGQCLLSRKRVRHEQSNWLHQLRDLCHCFHQEQDSKIDGNNIRKPLNTVLATNSSDFFIGRPQIEAELRARATYAR